MSKKCVTCGKIKPLSEFYKHKWNKDGYRGQCKECLYKIDRERVDKIKREIFVHYSGDPPKCQCCGEDTFEFLSIDHIKNDGAEHRRTIMGASQYWWIYNKGFPEGFQVLCRNCNWAKYAYGECPHKKQKPSSKKQHG